VDKKRPGLPGQYSFFIVRLLVILLNTPSPSPLAIRLQDPGHRTCGLQRIFWSCRALPEPAPYSVTAPNISGSQLQKQEIVPQTERFFAVVPNIQQGKTGGGCPLPERPVPVADRIF
jgi:hypothetical protein